MHFPEKAGYPSERRVAYFGGKQSSEREIYAFRAGKQVLLFAAREKLSGEVIFAKKPHDKNEFYKEENYGPSKIQITGFWRFFLNFPCSDM